MAIVFDKAQDTPGGNKYLHKKDHRDGGNGKKSQWKIKPPDEIACFDEALKRTWGDMTKAWGLRLVGTTAQKLGTSIRGDDLRIAKFVNGNPAWHGYPADYRTKLQDRPPTAVLRKWVAAGIIGKNDVARIRGGCNAPCSPVNSRRFLGHTDLSRPAISLGYGKLPFRGGLGFYCWRHYYARAAPCDAVRLFAGGLSLRI